MFLKKMDLLEEDDFEMFRIPFISGRQTPRNLIYGLILGVAVQTLLGFVAFGVVKNITDINVMEKLISWCYLVFTIIIIFLSILCMFIKNQSKQYLVVSLMLLNVTGISLYVVAIYLLKLEIGISSRTFITFIGINLILFISFFIIMLIRLNQSLQKGYFRKDSKKYKYEEKFKNDKKALKNVPQIGIALVGAIFIIRFLFSQYLSMDIETLIMTFLFLMMPYISLYMFAHSLVTYYCKKRFASFNFDEDGNLYPLGSGDKVRDKEKLA